MTKRKYYYISENSLLEDLLYPPLILYFLYLVYLFFTNRANFWRWVFYGCLAFGGLIAILFFCQRIRSKLFWKRFKQTLRRLKESGKEEYLKNFISRFGFEGKKGKGWSFRNYSFDWDRINDLKKILLEAGVISKEKEVFDLLRYYIQQKEEQLTRESIKKEPQKLASLTGKEFEKLLYRLFEKMGYKVQLVGGIKDQGGDLILNKGSERILVQAKCYRDWPTGNKAIQEAVAAMKYYDCNRAMVVTTSYFTDEAITLAKANNVELIPKEKLQELLLKFLGENWF